MEPKVFTFSPSSVEKARINYKRNSVPYLPFKKKPKRLEIPLNDADISKSRESLFAQYRRRSYAENKKFAKHETEELLRCSSDLSLDEG
ncbi:hypothetical protein SNE40_021591 [Patella caerulea]